MFNVFVVVIWLCFYHAQACLSVYFVSLLRSSLHLIANSLFLGMFWQFHAAKSKFILFFLHVYSLYVFFFFIFVPTLSTIMLTRDSVVLVSRAAIATHHKVGGSDQQKLPLSSGGQKFKIKVSTESCFL